MDEVLEKARKRREELVDRRRKLQMQMAQVDGELKELESFFLVAVRFGAKDAIDTINAQDAAQQLASLAAQGPWSGTQWPGFQAEVVDGVTGRNAFIHGVVGVGAGGVAVPHGSKTKVIVNLARDIIRALGPLPARRILEMIDQSGAGEALIPGRDEKGRISYLSAVLSKDERFESDRDAGGYKLVEQEGPPPGPRLAGMKPQQEYYGRKVNPGAENAGDPDDLLKSRNPSS
jgi:hypothetical protein